MTDKLRYNKALHSNDDRCVRALCSCAVFRVLKVLCTSPLRLIAMLLGTGKSNLSATEAVRFDRMKAEFGERNTDDETEEICSRGAVGCVGCGSAVDGSA